MKHRSRLRLIAVFFVASTLAGCSVHPLPQDVSPASTVQIVSRIRCEAKEGLEAALQKAASQGPMKRKHAEKIIGGTTIGFEFQFEMAENNKAAANQLKFEREAAKAGGSFQIIVDAKLNDGHSANGDKTRQNTRTFRVVDDMKELEAARCGRRSGSAEPNLIYPVTGSTGMAEVVSTYIELEMMTDLASASDRDPVTFADRLVFVTTFEAGTAVDLELRSPVGTLKLTQASLAGSALRRDTHKVNVVLTRDPKLGVDQPETARAKIDRQLAKFDEVQDSALRARLTRRKALGRNRVLIELDRQRLVAEEKAVAARVLGVPLP